MIDQKTFDSLKSPYNSWAYWDDKFPERGCVCDVPSDICRSLNVKIKKLNSNVVLVGLNPTKKLFNNCESFHFPISRGHSRDVKLKRMIQDLLTAALKPKKNKISGAFMTDLYDIVAKDNQALKEEIKQNNPQEDLKKYRDNFLKKIEILISDPNFKNKKLTIIILGRNTYDHALPLIFNIPNTKRTKALRAYSSTVNLPKGKSIDVTIFEVWHYSTAISYNDFIKRYTYINSQI